jgi:hypothetical protein
MTKSLVYKFVNLRNQLGFLAPELGGASRHRGSRREGVKSSSGSGDYERDRGMRSHPGSRHDGGPYDEERDGLPHPTKENENEHFLHHQLQEEAHAHDWWVESWRGCER